MAPQHVACEGKREAVSWSKSIYVVYVVIGNVASPSADKIPIRPHQRDDLIVT